MNEIEIKVENDQMLVTSLQVAKNFNKNHQHILRDIKNLIGGVQNWTDLFYESSYVNEQNKQEYPMYLMTRDGFTLLAMGFTGKEALEWKLKYIKAFNDMEAKLNDPMFLVQKSMKFLENRCNELLLENQQMKPKALFADAVSTSEESILIGQLAKLIRQNGYDIGQNRLFQWLRDNGYLIKSGSRYNQPTQKAMDLELFEVKERTITNPDGSIRITLTTKVTGKGQVYFVNKFLNQ
ncbi:phage regulatory protein/antirepressor Ant [Thomasclavelia sp.]|uniref:phage regulatory protein/antirepressor Ant n=1 Tax=Thomasclavelia sp. TaxID=3025757 RepID=UPI0025DCB039|nr:phage regulatory protein/antirepressor Ant [Thomasclavelia sp.]